MTQLAPDNLMASTQIQDIPRLPSLADFQILTKPRITVLVMVTGAIGFFMGGYAESGIAFSANWPLWTLIGTLLGIGLSCMGACAINQVIERHTDSLMHRTENRPLPMGRLHPASAMWIGGLLSIMGVGTLWFVANGLTALLSAATILSYSFIYTPMKRHSSLSTLVGAVPGALPPVMGAAAISGRIGTEAILLFAIMFLWQLPHFLAIAWLYREDYARAGIQVLPVEDRDGQSTFRQAVLGSAVLLPLGLLPTMMGITGTTCFFGALALGVGFLISNLWMAFKQNRQSARISFFASLIYLPAVFCFMLADQIV